MNWGIENTSYEEYLKDCKYRRHGLTHKIIEELYEEQNNSCAICKKTISLKRLEVDHNHKTRKLRGLLCHKCNLLLGYAKDNLKILQNAMNYIKNPPIHYREK